MMFWLVCAVMTLAVTAVMVTPLLRPKEMGDDNPDIAIYRAQLAEIDRDLERELLATDEAKRARTEVARRLLAANKAAVAPAGITTPTRWLAAAIVAVVLALGFGTYWTLGAPGYPDLPLQARLAASEEMRANRPSQAALEAAAPAPPPVEVPDDYREAIDQLRVIAPTRPNDLEAWSRLAYHEVELRNYAGAADAQAQVNLIKGEATEIADLQRLLDLLVVAAGGLVSPEAEEVIRQIFDRDEQNTAARYYLGALYNQTDRPDLALRLWRDIIETGDPNNFHIASARSQVSDAAFRAGIEYAVPEARGPSFEQMDAASDMSAEDREAMIGGMVSGLASRLATEGGPAQDWARLIRAYGVLGDQEAARMVWTEAQQVFVSSMRGMEILTNAARDAGVLEE
ncbi:cytochrome c-type biogenesis protein CcmH [Yoonia maricola]|uniref:Cytochrome c-type biogenesis protein CcmH n=1 Tax=Yoonia maricola TaxID=420999 RepID=A0A2M8WMS6_9RHOB|nr:c-type cytochrome biogenesis protein CcmI [Yoonia maricola]PJI92235.1 cytochrome c-type biogenesis protein CcmH [Yoonia maricola]